MNAAHAHLLINHLPIMGAFLALPLVALALWRRRDPGSLIAAVVVLTLSGMGALAALRTGEPAEEAVERLPGISEPAIETHEERAETATVLSVLAGVAGIGWLTLRRRETRVPQVAGAATLALSLASAGAMAWTGSSGGPIHHEEIRDGTAASAAAGSTHGDGSGEADGEARQGDEGHERDELHERD